ncbi:MAG: SH3 domain-containing protein [Chloroflexota bacterium]
MKRIPTRSVLLCLALVIVCSFALLVNTPTALAQSQTGSNWSGYYWNNINFSGNPTATRIDPAVNFNWIYDPPIPGGNFPGTNWSARWYNTINFGGGTYRFRAGADDGIRVAIDNNKVYDAWHDTPAGFAVGTFDLTLGAGNHTIIVDYYQKTGAAGVLFDWTTLSGLPAIEGTGTPIGTPASGATALALTSIPPTLIPNLSNLPFTNVRAQVIASLANVRSAPTTESTPVAEVKLNDQLRVLANNGANTWFFVQIPNGQRGWIFRRMIYLYGGDWTKIPVLQEAVANPGPVQDVQGEARSSILVRNGPSTRNSEKIGTLNQGQTFKILKLSRNRAWVFIDADGLQGWVFLPNIKVVFGQLGRVAVGN